MPYDHVTGKRKITRFPNSLAHHKWIIFERPSTSQIYVLKIWDENKYYAWGTEGELFFFPNGLTGEHYSIYKWSNKCIPTSIMYKFLNKINDWNGMGMPCYNRSLINLFYESC